MVFVSLAAVLVAGSFTRVGASPSSQTWGAPREGLRGLEPVRGWESSCLRHYERRRLIRPLRESIQGSRGSYFIVDGHLSRGRWHRRRYIARVRGRQSVARPTDLKELYSVWVGSLFSGLDFLAQVTIRTSSFPRGHKVFARLMLVHMFFAGALGRFISPPRSHGGVGCATGSPGWTASRTRWCGSTSDVLQRVRFAVLVLLVLLVGFYPQLTAAIFTQFFIIVLAMLSMFLAL